MMPSKPGKLFAQMQGRIAELSKELSETKYKWGVSLHELDSLRAERDSLTERVREMTAERDSLSERVSELIAQNERLTEICARYSR